VIQFLWPGGTETREISGRMTVQYRGNCMIQKDANEGMKYSKEGERILLTKLILDGRGM
jgi:hypothetical protein